MYVAAKFNTKKSLKIEAEYDRLAQTVRESIDMNLINTLIR